MASYLFEPFHHPSIILLQLFHTGNPGKLEIGQVRGDLTTPCARAGAWGSPSGRSRWTGLWGRARAGPAQGDGQPRLAPGPGAAPGGRRCRRHVAAGCDRRGRLEIPVDQAPGRTFSLPALDGTGFSSGRSWNCDRWQFAPPLMRGAILCRRRAKRALSRAVRRALGGNRGVLPPEPQPAPPAVQRACPKRRGGGTPPRRDCRESWPWTGRGDAGKTSGWPVDPVVGTQLGECPGVPPRDLGYAPQERGVRRGGRSERDVERGNAPRHAPGSLATGGGPHVVVRRDGGFSPRHGATHGAPEGRRGRSLVTGTFTCSMGSVNFSDLFWIYFLQGRARQRPGVLRPRHGREARDPGVFRRVSYTSSYGKAYQ